MPKLLKDRVLTIDSATGKGAPKYRGDSSAVIHDHGTESHYLVVHAPIKNGESTVRIKKIFNFVFFQFCGMPTCLIKKPCYFL